MRAPTGVRRLSQMACYASLPTTHLPISLIATPSPDPMESIEPAKVTKEGPLGKMGGGAGGHKNWKDRYFVLSDHLYYYESKQVRAAAGDTC